MRNDLIRTKLQTAPKKLFLLGTLTVIVVIQHLSLNIGCIILSNNFEIFLVAARIVFSIS